MIMKDRFLIQYTMFPLINENCSRKQSLEKKEKSKKQNMEKNVILLSEIYC